MVQERRLTLGPRLLPYFRAYGRTLQRWRTLAVRELFARTQELSCDVGTGTQRVNEVELECDRDESVRKKSQWNDHVSLRMFGSSSVRMLQCLKTDLQLNG